VEVVLAHEVEVGVESTLAGDVARRRAPSTVTIWVNASSLKSESGSIRSISTGPPDRRERRRAVEGWEPRA